MSITVFEETTTVDVIEDDGTTVTVDVVEEVVSIEDTAAPGPEGPAHESYPFTMQAEIEVVDEGLLTEIPLAGPGIIESVQGTLKQAPTGSDAIFDVQLNGVSIWTDPADRPTWLDGSNTDVGPIDEFDLDTFVQGDKLRVVPIQVGSTFRGFGACLVVRVRLT